MTVSGRIDYERVPFSTVQNEGYGLNYPGTVEMPARQVTVEALNACTSAVLASGRTNDTGQYSLSVPSNLRVIVRAKAESVLAAPGWDIRVFNNTNGNALYVLDSAEFTTSATTATKNLLAQSGWPDLNGTTYSGVRASAPFAILDSMYTAVRFIRANGGATLALPALKVFWSKDNKTSTTWTPANGSIGNGTQYLAQAYSGAPAGIYVLGQEGVDTDEFDQHVIVHEFYHYLEAAISRGDSIGGSHTLHDRVDMRVAFSEGMGNAFSGMVLDDPKYRDSYGARQGSSFFIDVENETSTPPGWYNEVSVQSLAWDLFDDTQDVVEDDVALGFAPMLDALVNDIPASSALASIYPFVAAIGTNVGASVAADIDTLMKSQHVYGTGVYGSGETNDGDLNQFVGDGLIPEALPIYHDLALGGTQRVCGSAKAGSYNKAGNRLFLKFSLASARTVELKSVYVSAGSTVPLTPSADPDFVLHDKDGVVLYGENETGTTETESVALPAGDYVIEAYDFSHVDTEATTRRGVTCMDVSIS